MVAYRSSRRRVASCEMNMTPLIDVAFQLIIFFMLVSNIVAEENPLMIVPSLDQPQARPIEQGNRVFVNVVPGPFNAALRADGSGQYLQWPGDPVGVKIGLDWFAMDQLGAVTAALREMKAARPELKVLLRADAALFHGAIAPVMDAIRAAGIEDVGLVSYVNQQQL